jgi:hypothetical protein
MKQKNSPVRRSNRGRSVREPSLEMFAEAVGQYLDASPRSDRSLMMAMTALVEAPGAADRIAAALIDTIRQPPGTPERLDGLIFMLGSALDHLRISGNGGDTTTPRQISDVRRQLETLASEDAIPAHILIGIGHAFATAQVDIGEVLQAAFAATLGGDEQNLDAAAGSQEGFFDDLALECAHDPYLIHEQIALNATLLPAEDQAGMGLFLLSSEVSSVQEAALGFAFSKESVVSCAILDALATLRSEPPIPSIMVERLVHMRPWFTGAAQGRIDNAIRHLRKRAAAPVAQSDVKILDAVASICDGSGAQNFMILAQRGPQTILAVILLKVGKGVAEAWAQVDMSRREAEQMMRDVNREAGGAKVSAAFIEERLARGIATHLEQKTLPPFRLLQVAEMLVLKPIRPAAESIEGAVDALLADVPVDQKDAASIERAHHVFTVGSGRHRAILRSWFEAGEGIEALLRPIRSNEKRIQAVLTEYLPKRRAFWAECCATTAATLAASADRSKNGWCDFALVAREWMGTRPLHELPLAMQIASTSVTAFSFR